MFVSVSFSFVICLSHHLSRHRPSFVLFLFLSVSMSFFFTICPLSTSLFLTVFVCFSLTIRACLLLFDNMSLFSFSLCMFPLLHNLYLSRYLFKTVPFSYFTIRVWLFLVHCASLFTFLYTLCTTISNSVLFPSNLAVPVNFSLAVCLCLPALFSLSPSNPLSLSPSLYFCLSVTICMSYFCLPACAYLCLNFILRILPSPLCAYLHLSLKESLSFHFRRLLCYISFVCISHRL